MRPDETSTPGSENQSGAEPTDTAGKLDDSKARAITQAASVGLSPEEDAVVRRDAAAGRRKPTARKAVRRAKSMGPTGRARAAAKGVAKPAKGKRRTAAKTSSKSAMETRKRRAPSKASKPTKGAAKAVRRVRNRSRA